MSTRGSKEGIGAFPITSHNSASQTGAHNNGYWSLSERYSSQCCRKTDDCFGLLCQVFFCAFSLGRSGVNPVMSWGVEWKGAGEWTQSGFFSVLCLTFRHDKNKRRVQEVSEKLRDNRDLQHFLQNTQDVSSPTVYCPCNHWVTSIISLIMSSLRLDITFLLLDYCGQFPKHTLLCLL